ncbi:MAG: J domain-containing protein [Saprospiraceae bacterium]|nr:J domain-containing protein [Saprospiraceae bacterium]
MAELSKLAKEIKELEKTIRKTLKLKKKDKMELESLTESATLDDIVFQSKLLFGNLNFTEEDVLNQNFNERAQNQHTDEFNRQRRAVMFDEFTVKPDAEEQQNLRKIFISLASDFHPDKAENEQQAKFFHDIMQQINAAYQRGDIDELLDLKKRFEHLTNQEALEIGANLLF